MLCRTTKLTHKTTGVSLDTPLLVPSFSSKGFSRSSKTGASKKEEGFLSRLHQQLESVSEFVTDTFLVSAFDIYHQYLPQPEKLKQLPELIFLDSGGYEISDYADLSDTEEPEKKQKPWNEDMLKVVFDKWPDELATVLVSYDHPEKRTTFEEQISAARELFRKRDAHLKTFLLKPETNRQETLRDVLAKAFGKIDELKYFDIIGVTEREIGSSTKERMVNIAKLRLALDDAGMKTIPLHIFGALDPIAAALYFMAGAEIFDGLTWLRYAYANSQCIYTHNHGPIAFGLEARDDYVRARTQANNLHELVKIQNMLKEFHHTQDFSKLTKLGSWPGAELFFKDSWDTLATVFNGRIK